MTAYNYTKEQKNIVKYIYGIAGDEKFNWRCKLYKGEIYYQYLGYPSAEWRRWHRVTEEEAARCRLRLNPFPEEPDVNSVLSKIKQMQTRFEKRYA